MTHDPKVREAFSNYERALRVEVVAKAEHQHDAELSVQYAEDLLVQVIRAACRAEWDAELEGLRDALADLLAAHDDCHGSKNSIEATARNNARRLLASPARKG